MSIIQEILWRAFPVTLVLTAFGSFITALEAFRAPEGYEGPDGFHYGKEDWGDKGI